MDDRFTVYECAHCGMRFIEEDWGDLLEETLWGHIQMEHEDVYNDIQDLDTPDMIATAYTKREDQEI